MAYNYTFSAKVTISDEILYLKYKSSVPTDALIGRRTELTGLQVVLSLSIKSFQGVQLVGGSGLNILLELVI